MNPARLHANPDVRHDIGRVALRRGPLIYCVEAQDVDTAPQSMRLPPDAPLAMSWNPDLLGGIVTLTAPARRIDRTVWGDALYRQTAPTEVPSTLLAVPYYIWCNRGANAMQVWLRE